MFTTSLLPVPPPSTSLLPPLSLSSTETTHSHMHHSHSRRKAIIRANTPLTLLSHDERLIASRKLAIAMYGYSWLKPAGCNKTMLGRREEELEREEVERQLREVELQERMALEQEEQERRDALTRQGEGGDVEATGERDLDDDVPEADDVEHDGSRSVEGDDEAEEDLDGDLDDDIPDADADDQETSWIYDTRREPDTDTEEDDSMLIQQQDHVANRSRHSHNLPPQHTGRRLFGLQAGIPNSTDPIVHTMLNEDELGGYEHQQDLDDDVPDADLDVDMDADISDRDLDSDIPSADDEPGWEHTDSELEESEMDISLLPPHPNSASRNPGTTHEEMRRISGNRMLPPALPPSLSTAQSQGPHQRPEPHHLPETNPRRNLRRMMRTPGTADEVSALISTGGTSLTSTDPVSTAAMAAAAEVTDGDDQNEFRSPNRRSWLNPAGARRNLFGGFRTNTTAAEQRQQQLTSTPPVSSLSSTTAPNLQSQTRQTETHLAPTGPSRLVTTATGPISSGGLFTPSPRQIGNRPTGIDYHDDDDDDDDDEDNNDEDDGESSHQITTEQQQQQQQQQQQNPPSSRTRSGRLLSGLSSMGMGRRTTRRTRPGET